MSIFSMPLERHIDPLRHDARASFSRCCQHRQSTVQPEMDMAKCSKREWATSD